MSYLVDILGWMGAVFLLSAYILNITNKIKADSIYSLSMNLFGALCLIINAYFNAVYPFVIINLFWAVASIVQLFQATNAVSKNKEH